MSIQKIADNTVEETLQITRKTKHNKNDMLIEIEINTDRIKYLEDKNEHIQEMLALLEQINYLPITILEENYIMCVCVLLITMRTEKEIEMRRTASIKEDLVQGEASFRIGYLKALEWVLGND